MNKVANKDNAKKADKPAVTKKDEKVRSKTKDKDVKDKKEDKAGKAKTKKENKSSNEGIKRNKNSFAFFGIDVRARITKENPEAKPKDIMGVRLDNI
jgi:hypothetical protein